MRDLSHCQKIVIKVGTSLLTSTAGIFSHAKLEKLGHEISGLIRGGKKVVLVSSGAIGLGMDVQDMKERPRSMAQLQACAAIGQGKLIHAYEKFFSKRNLHTAQILLTRDVLENRGRFLKARQTLDELLKMRVLPIINENDTVATDEIAFGDNDILSVHVAHLVHADLLIILSDVDGFFLKDGSRVRHVSSEEEIERDLVKHLKGKVNIKSVGGMKAKLAAARVSMRLSMPLLIVNGHEEGIIERALQGEDVGTFFSPGENRRNAREKWIAFSAARRGALIVDDGAYRALKSGKNSLLARGILKMRGQFGCREVVELETQGDFTAHPANCQPLFSEDGDKKAKGRGRGPKVKDSAQTKAIFGFGSDNLSDSTYGTAWPLSSKRRLR